jgi:hypothetical protein
VCCSGGELVLFDTDQWERNDANIYELGSGVGAMCWLSACSCLVAPTHSLHVYTYTARGGASAAETVGGAGVGAMQGRDSSSSQNFPVTMSPIPLVLDTAPFETALADSSVPWKGLSIYAMKAELCTGLVAVSLQCSLEDSPDTLIVPAVAVYLASMSPQLSMTVVRVVSFHKFNMEDTSILKQQPISFEFRGPKSSYKYKSVYSADTPGSSRRGGGRASGSSSSNALTARNGAAVLVVMWNVGAISIEECGI